MKPPHLLLGDEVRGERLPTLFHILLHLVQEGGFGRIPSETAAQYIPNLTCGLHQFEPAGVECGEPHHLTGEVLQRHRS